MGIKSYGVSMTTLEEVFLKLGKSVKQIMSYFNLYIFIWSVTSKMGDIGINQSEIEPEISLLMSQHHHCLFLSPIIFSFTE